MYLRRHEQSAKREPQLRCLPCPNDVSQPDSVLAAPSLEIDVCPLAMPGRAQFGSKARVRWNVSRSMRIFQAMSVMGIGTQRTDAGPNGVPSSMFAGGNFVTTVLSCILTSQRHPPVALAPRSAGLGENEGKHTCLPAHLYVWWLSGGRANGGRSSTNEGG